MEEIKRFRQAIDKICLKGVLDTNQTKDDSYQISFWSQSQADSSVLH